MYPSHMTVRDTYNVYGEYAGKWSTCSICGRQDKGWKGLCPDAWVVREWDSSESYAHVEVDHEEGTVTIAYLDGLTHVVSKDYAKKVIIRRSR
jgi:hypothetical protein